MIDAEHLDRIGCAGETPRTDAAAFKVEHRGLNNGWTTEEVSADFARTLERELAAVTAERDAANKQMLEWSSPGIYQGWIKGIIAQRDAARALAAQWQSEYREAAKLNAELRAKLEAQG